MGGERVAGTGKRDPAQALGDWACIAERTGDDSEEGPSEALHTSVRTQQLQSALAEIGDVSSAVYHVQILLDDGTAEADRRALVTGLENEETSIAHLERRVDSSARNVLEFLIAPKCSIETVTGAIERCSFVDRVLERQLIEPRSSEETSDDDRQPTADFERYLDTVDTVAAETLLDDPVYVDLIESSDEFSLPEDELTLREVLEGVDEEQDSRREWFGEGSDDDDGTQQDERSGAADESRSDGVSPLELRVRYLESRLAEHAAYADAMEEVLDRQKSQAERIDGLETGIESLGETIAVISGTTDEHRREQERMLDALDDLECQLENVQNAVEDIGDWRERVTAATQGGRREGAVDHQA